MLATARLVKQSSALRRSVLFMAPTAEECGLLGSEFYASNPLPFDGLKLQPIAAFAFDVGNVWGKTSDLAVLGYGKSNLDPILERLQRHVDFDSFEINSPRWACSIGAITGVSCAEVFRAAGSSLAKTLLARMRGIMRR